MLFNSISFMIFFPIVVFIFFIVPYRFRWIFLLAASYYFYMSWKPQYIVLIIVSTLIDYFAGRMMGRTDDRKKRRKYLLLSIFSNLGLLFTFKYFNFFNMSVGSVFSHFHASYPISNLSLLLPVGISFYTFQTMSYTIDVYRGLQKEEKHLGIFALYVSFFPQLVAGPIERSLNLLPQFRRETSFDFDRVAGGLKLMLWGLFKKVVIADRVAFLVNTVYGNPHNFAGFQLVLATLFFAFQIYCDFSGYSDIAIGAAQILGFKLMDNFNRPYFSKSISEFWKRWHISLSTWFRDYLYIPLGGSRVRVERWYFNLFITFLISGFWHGANWTFLVWGALNGVYLIVETILNPYVKAVEKKLRIKTHSMPYKLMKVGGTFLLVLFAWIFFRANSLSDAFSVIGRIHISFFKTFMEIATLNENAIDKLGIGKLDFIIAVASILFMEFVHTIQRHGSIRNMLRKKPLFLRYAVYIIFIFGIIAFGTFVNSSSFIYFQF